MFQGAVSQLKAITLVAELDTSATAQQLEDLRCLVVCIQTCVASGRPHPIACASQVRSACQGGRRKRVLSVCICSSLGSVGMLMLGKLLGITHRFAMSFVMPALCS